jgi:hypothetical protein
MAISPLVDNVTSCELAVLCLALYIDRLANCSVQLNDIFIQRLSKSYPMIIQNVSNHGPVRRLKLRSVRTRCLRRRQIPTTHPPTTAVLLTHTRPSPTTRKRTDSPLSTQTPCRLRAATRKRDIGNTRRPQNDHRICSQRQMGAGDSISRAVEQGLHRPLPRTSSCDLRIS